MNFKCKRILAIVMICVFALSGAAFAKGKAGGGGGFSAPAATTKSLTPSAPKTTAPKTEAPKTNAADQNKANTTTNNAANNTANSAAANKTNAAGQTTQNSGSRWGSALRNIGLFAGGMFLGSMLSSMFGFGMGSMFADILGALFNIVLIAVVVMLLMALFRKLFGKKKNDNVYAASRYPEENIRCPNCGWVSPDRNNPPKFCPECGTRMNGNDGFTNHHVYSDEQDAQYTESRPGRIIDITPPKDKDKF